MTYCLGIVTKHGLVMASDSRTNAGYDQINTTRKTHTFVQPGERVFVLLASGSLSLTQSIVTLLREDFDAGGGLATANSMYEAARVVGEQVRNVSELDRAALERDEYRFNVHLILGGQVKGQKPDLIALQPDELCVRRQHRFADNDPGLMKIRTRWEQALRQAVLKLPNIRFKVAPETTPGSAPEGESIELVEGGDPAVGDLQPQQMQQRTQGGTEEKRR